MKCPKCDSEQLESKSCINCGVIFENFYRSQKKSSPETPPPVDSAPRIQSNEEPVKMDLNSLHGVALGTVSVLAGIKAMFLDLSLISTLILVPFYFCYVPVLTAFFGDGLYMYWRWEGRFLRYEGRWRKPLVVFNFVFSVVFIVMFFKINR